MHLRRVLNLINRGSRGRVLMAHVAVGLVCALCGLGLISWQSLSISLQRHFSTQLPAQELLVETQKVDLSLFRFHKPGAIAELNAHTLESLASIPGVTTVHPITTSSIPVSVSGSLFSTQFGSQAFVSGVDPSWISEDVSHEQLNWDREEPVPVVISDQILAIYNSGFAKSQHLPELSKSAVLGRKFRLSFRHGNGQTRQFEARVAGFSPKLPIGLYTSNAVLQHIHQDMALIDPYCGQAVLAVESVTHIQDVKSAVEEMGLVLHPPNPLADALNKGKSMISVVLVLTGAIMLLLSVAYLNQSLALQFHVKHHEYRICRVMGMSSRQLGWVLYLEYVAATLLDAVVGIALSIPAAHLLFNGFLAPFVRNLVGIRLDLVLRLDSLTLLVFSAALLVHAMLIPRIWIQTTRTLAPR